MAKRGKRPVPVNVPESEKTIIINPNRIKVRDMRGILLSGCGPHGDKKKKQNKYQCRTKSRNDDSGLYYLMTQLSQLTGYA